MTYNEQRLAVASSQLKLMLIGFDVVVKDMVDEYDEGYAAKIEPYANAISEMKDLVTYLTKEVQNERAKE